MLEVTATAWIALVAGLVALLALDLLVVHRREREVSMRDAAWSTAGFVAVAVAFGIALGLTEGSEVAGQYFAGYLLEKSLSLDNIFVWSLIMTAFAVPSAYQHRLLFYGIFGALVLRGGFVAAGSGLLSRFDWVVYAFGVLLLVSGVRLLRGKRPPAPERHWAVRTLRARLPTTEHIRGSHLFVRARSVPPAERPSRPPIAGWYVTPLLAVLVVIELTDLIFAVDSIPAIFGVTREPFLVFSATALALLGLRSMYFLLAGMRHRFAGLDKGLAVILAFVGAKFLLTDVVEIGVGVSLLVIVSVMAASIVTSLSRSP